MTWYRFDFIKWEDIHAIEENWCHNLEDWFLRSRRVVNIKQTKVWTLDIDMASARLQKMNDNSFFPLGKNVISLILLKKAIYYWRRNHYLGLTLQVYFVTKRYDCVINRLLFYRKDVYDFGTSRKILKKTYLLFFGAYCIIFVIFWQVSVFYFQSASTQHLF